jgi:hypothetical protein
LIDFTLGANVFVRTHKRVVVDQDWYLYSGGAFQGWFAAIPCVV